MRYVFRCPACGRQVDHVLSSLSGVVAIFCDQDLDLKPHERTLMVRDWRAEAASVSVAWEHE